MAVFDRSLVVFGGLCGALGVGLSALAAHAGGDNLHTAASFLLMHAPALLALSLIASNRLRRIGAFVLIVGLVLFCGDLVARHFTGGRLIPYAAPGGGLLLIAGWLAVAISGLVRR